MNFKTAIQEQNSFPGYTNRLLSKRVKLIFVAYNNLKKLFSKNNVFNYGNPIRKIDLNTKEDPYDYFKLNADSVFIFTDSIFHPFDKQKIEITNFLIQHKN